MELDLMKIMSMGEKVSVDKGLGLVPANGPTPEPTWKGPPHEKVPYTVRDDNARIAMMLYNLLTDASSDGTKISVDGTYGGGNLTPGTGNFKINLPAGKTFQFFIDGAPVLNIDPSGVTITGSRIPVANAPTGLLVTASDVAIAVNVLMAALRVKGIIA
jgi:hypothetical protein